MSERVGFSWRVIIAEQVSKNEPLMPGRVDLDGHCEIKAVTLIPGRKRGPDAAKLKPLFPLYVSTVDSGNLVGHLLVLRSGLLELTEAKLLRPSLFAGLKVTASVLLDEARKAQSRRVS